MQGKNGDVLLRFHKKTSQCERGLALGPKNENVDCINLEQINQRALLFSKY